MKKGETTFLETNYAKLFQKLFKKLMFQQRKIINYYLEIEIFYQSSNAGEVKLHVVMKLHSITSKHRKQKQMQRTIQKNM